jgi:hypothetical protein
VCVFVWRSGASGAAPTVDAMVAFQGIRAFRDSAIYTAGGGTGVRVSDIVKDYLPLAPLLDQSTEDIVDTSLFVPHAAWPTDPKTPREVMAEWNAYHRNVLKIGGPNLDRIVFEPQAARATLRVDTSEPGARFADASISSGADIYNRTIVRGSSGSGEALSVERTSALLPSVQSLPAAGVQALNPSALVSANDWATIPGPGQPIPTRDTTVFATSPASIKYDPGAGTPINTGVGLAAYFGGGGGTYKAGATYVLTFALRVTYPGIAVPFDVRFGVLGVDDAATQIRAGASNTWATFSIAWTPKSNLLASGVKLTVVRGTLKTRQFVAAPTFMWMDDLAVGLSVANIIDRRGFRRTYVLDVGSPSDEVAMGALGDAHLGLHRTTPLKGSLEVSSDDAVTELASGRSIPASELGLYVGEIVNLANLSDPDVPGGTIGRNGRVAAAGVGDTTTLTIDNERTAFQALLARLAVVKTPRVSK